MCGHELTACRKPFIIMMLGNCLFSRLSAALSYLSEAEPIVDSLDNSFILLKGISNQWEMPHSFTALEGGAVIPGYTLSVAPKIYANACARLFGEAFAGFDLMFASLLDCKKNYFSYTEPFNNCID